MFIILKKLIFYNNVYYGVICYIIIRNIKCNYFYELLFSIRNK